MVQIALQFQDSVGEGKIRMEQSQRLSATALLLLREDKYMQSFSRASVGSGVRKPLVATSRMKEGSLNEASVLRAVPSSVSNHKGCYLRDRWIVFSDSSRYVFQYEPSFKVLGVESVGLVCLNETTMFGDSPDAIFIYAYIDGVRQPAAVEEKTMSRPRSLGIKRLGPCILIISAYYPQVTLHSEKVPQSFLSYAIHTPRNCFRCGQRF